MSDALAAALLAGQRRRSDPYESSRKYGQMLLQQGSSTAPVRSPLEGLARALTGAAGGFFEGQAERAQTDRDKRTIGTLSAALGAKSPQERTQILKGLDGDAEFVGPLLGSMLTQQMADERKTTLGTRNFNALAPGAGMTIDMTKQPAISGGEVPPLPAGNPGPGAFGNNLGNIRATNINWDGKGAPQNGFETFGTPQQGANAMAANLQAYIKANPGMTVAQAIAKWAPPNENDTDLYIRQVAEGTGINPAMPLAEVMKDQALGATLMDAITRKEKGGLPAGVTADTFMTAAAPGAAPQVAQGSADASGNALPPQAAVPAIAAPQMPEIAPAAAELEKQAQAAFQGGDIDRAVALRQKAQEAQAMYANDRAKKQDERAYDQAKTANQRAYEAAEHDRREAGKPLTKDQSDAAGFSDRMINSNRIIGQVGTPSTTAAKLRDLIPFGLGNYGQSEDYQKYKQARDDFINAQLRRESGAVIGLDEYASADRQYFPQPGDKPEVVAQKNKNRQLAVEAMTRAAGRTYEVNPTVNRPPAGTSAAPAGAPQVGDVIDGYTFKGGDPSRRESWEKVQ